MQQQKGEMVMSKAKFEIERKQIGEVEIDMNAVSNISSIKDALKDAAEQGLVKWKDTSQISILNLNMDAFIAKCYEKDSKEPYNLIVLAENRNNAIDLIGDYMAGITADEYTIKMSKADREDVIQYINDENAFNFESVFEIEDVSQDPYDETADLEY